MKLKYISIICFAVLVFFSCSHSIVVTKWKNEKPSGDNYNRIMVVGITGHQSDSVRLLTEKHFVNELRNLGYNAVAAYDEFGPGGLKDLTEETTYVNLCGRGIDAVITIALIDRSKDKNYPVKKSFMYPNNYYYSRIWNYRELQPDFTSVIDNNKSGYFWESILFNLRTLEAECTVQSRLYYTIPEKKMSADVEKKIIKKMTSEGVLRMQKKAIISGDFK